MTDECMRLRQLLVSMLNLCLCWLFHSHVCCRFKPSDGVICIAATNFPQSLDKALIRPGRFDRHVTVPNPDVKGRKEILEVHFKNVPAGKDVDLKVCFCGPGLGTIL